MALEVCLFSKSGPPPNEIQMRGIWQKRSAGRASPVLIVVLYDNRASLCGPAGDDPPAYLDLDNGQVERLCNEALDLPDRNVALRYLGKTLETLSSDLPGLRNSGFLAAHELRYRARRRADWAARCEVSRKLLGKSNQELLGALGFRVTRCDNQTSVLESASRKLALGVLLHTAENPEAAGPRFNGLSPISYALSVADRENLSYVVTVQDHTIRLYPTRLGTGVGRRGRTETYIECHTSLLRDDDAAFLSLIYTAEALSPGGTLEQLMEESVRFAGHLAENLRERIYGEVMPALAQGLANARRLRKPSPEKLAETYSMAMTVLFRLLFIAYAEDKDLLPYKFNGLYRRRSLKTKAQEILQLVGSNTKFEDGSSLWEETNRLYRAVDEGNREWSVPHYNGGLFSEEASVSAVGGELKKIVLPNSVFGPILRDLLLIHGDSGELGPVDFGSLGVREFGTIYEGLLESELSVAEADLATDREGNYVPAIGRMPVVVGEGHVYLHNRSGARKSSGSYFTKSFAVEHLLDSALEPALAQHLRRLDSLDELSASEAFFDFRAADISMGSGHFLVAAIDRIEKGLSAYLAKRKLPYVVKELGILRESARTALGVLADQIEIEDNQLLRRLIAKRCIYGVDLNPISVQLARLAIWIHTFVPGLPLSLLDRNLVHGNSLIGVGTVGELKQRFERAETETDLFVAAGLVLDARTLLDEATGPLQRLAHISDATFEDIRRGHTAIKEAEAATAPARALCDIITALPLLGGAPDGEDAAKWERHYRPLARFRFEDWNTLKREIVDSPAHKLARQLLCATSPFHFPIAFPEVFLRSRSGFDVILGNPPWEEVVVEEQKFWSRHFPGLLGLSQRDQERAKEKYRVARPDLAAALEQEIRETDTLRKVLTSGLYPGMGTGDPDFYKAFTWRFWYLVNAEGGRVGVVLPRSALSAKGAEAFRKHLLKTAAAIDCCFLVNNGGWIFDTVHQQYTISLTTITRSPAASETVVTLSGPFASAEGFRQSRGGAERQLKAADILSWNDTASLPLLPSGASLDVFLQLRKSARLDGDFPGDWRVRPHTELHATNEKYLMELEANGRERSYWPVCAGESFDLWTPDTGSYFAWADSKKLLPYLQEKRIRSATRGGASADSPEVVWSRDPDTLPCLGPRLCFRDVTRATDSRTMRVALVPPRVFLTNKAPYFIFLRGTERDQAYVLGVLSSLVLDWYARRFIEINANFFIINPFPVPRTDSKSALREIVIARAGRLAAVDGRFRNWAKEVGVECGPLPEDERESAIHEIDAAVAHLYGLTEEQLVHIFETFHVGWDCQGRLAATLKQFRKLVSKKPHQS